MKKSPGLVSYMTCMSISSVKSRQRVKNCLRFLISDPWNNGTGTADLEVKMSVSSQGSRACRYWDILVILDSRGLSCQTV